MVEGNAVYISFNRCEDTIRYSFLSHLSAGFHRRGISFEDPASDHYRVSEACDAAIANSKVSLVILSDKYASSKGCLDELVNVFERRGSNGGQVVIPVFYGLTKSELRKQCLKLKQMYPEDRVADDRRHALLKIVDLPGHASSLERSDSELVEEIVADVRQKLDLTGKIGVYSRLMKIESLLCKQPWGIRSLGIWGMGGIGKTTLAEAAFEQLLSGGFEASCFIKDFDNAFQEKGAYRLLEEHLGKKLGLSSHVTREKLRNKRILLVLDGVHKPLGATTFLTSFDLLGSGSVIIITSRDKHLLVQCRVNEIYEVQGLNEHEALQLLSRCAFGKDVPDQNLLKLSMKFVDYANGNRLALSVYGGELKGKTPSEMEIAVRELELFPEKIFHVLKKSYDALSDRDKEIFLHIVFSFRRENVDVDHVMQFLKGCGFFPRVGIDVLVDKSLVTISGNRVQMHNLIYNLGLKIIMDQTEEIGKGFRFLDTQCLLEDNEIREDGESEATSELGNEDIKAIILDTSDLDFKGHTSFQNMYNLRYLKIYSSQLTKDPEFRYPEDPQSSLPPELTLLHWENYPSQSFPQDFGVQHLVELNMPYSKLQKLWGGNKNLEVLKRIKLSHSLQLVNVDELQYSRNIELIDLEGCSSLQSFPDMGQSQHLRVVKLKDCSHLRSLPNMVTFDSLQDLDLSGCSELEEIQGFPRNLKELYLAKTAIREIPSYLSELVVLDMEDCKRLKNVPMGMSNMKSLASLKLSGCSELDNFQDLPRNLKELYLAGTAVKAFPSSLLENLSELVILSLENCKRLQHLPMGMSNMKSLVTLKLSGCSELEDIQDFPQNLKELYLVGTAIRKLPSSVGDLAELETLYLKNCKKLWHLPVEMQNLNPLKVLDLSDCSQLKKIKEFLPEAKELHLAGRGVSAPEMEKEAKQEPRHENTQRGVSKRSFNARFMWKLLKRML